MDDWEDVGEDAFVDDVEDDAVEAEEEEAVSDLDEYEEEASKAAEAEATAAGGSGAVGGEDDVFIPGMKDADELNFGAVKPWIGAIVEPSDWDPSAADDSKPDATLDIAYVHGYRCRAVYNNIGYTADGDVIYPAAAVGIVMNPETRAQSYYRGHRDDIISLDVSADRSLVVTGGKAYVSDSGRGRDPDIHVWDVATKETVAHIKGAHKRAVAAVAFSPDADYIVSVGMDNNHCISVHRVADGKRVAHAETGTDKVLGVGWSASTGFITTVGVKHCTFWRLGRGGFERPKKGLVGRKGKRCTQMSVAFTRGAAWTGTAGGDVYVWRGNQLKHVISRAHGKSRVCAIAANDEFVATGGLDGNVNLYTHKAKKVGSFEAGAGVRALAFSDAGNLAVGTSKGEVYDVSVEDAASGAFTKTQLHRGHFDGELWGMSIHPYAAQVCTGGDDNLIATWDLESNTIVASRTIATKAGKRPGRGKGASTMSKCAPNQCCRGIDWGPNGTIAVATNDGRVMLLDEVSLETIAEAHDSRQWIQAVKFDPTGDFLAVGSHDNNIYIYDTSGGALSLKTVCKGHNSFITSVDWDEAGMMLHSTCGAYELLFFDAESGDRLPSGATETRDTVWATWTAPFGFPVQGIWPKYSKGSDINTLDRSPDGTLLATGDDASRIKLFRFPCVNKDSAKSRVYRGHASHLTCVKFTTEGNQLVSVGGNDNTLIVWNVSV